MKHPKNRDETGLWANGLIVTLGLTAALVFVLLDRSTGHDPIPKLESLLLVGGALGLGIAVFAVVGGFGTLGRREAVLMVAMGVVAGACIVAADFAFVSGSGLALSTPFVVVIVMGLLRFRRR